MLRATGAKASTGNKAKRHGSKPTASPPQSDSQGSGHGPIVAETESLGAYVKFCKAIECIPSTG